MPVGRPISQNRKSFMLRVRMDEDTVSRLDDLCQMENCSRSEVVRKLIVQAHQSKERGYPGCSC